MNRAIDLGNCGKLPDAIQVLNCALAEFPESAGVRGYLAWFLLQLGQNEEAISRSREAIILAPASEKASLIHFHALWKSGNHADAVGEMNRYLAIKPSEQYANIIRELDMDTT
jgi:tetratricopeptide (TPR) repeat protein